jgi:predicted nucleic acid-binding protein
MFGAAEERESRPLSPKPWKRQPRGVVDTSVLVAGVAGFRSDPPRTPSAVLLRDWCEFPTFEWLVTDEILEEYLEVLTRLNVRGAAKVVRLIGEEAEYVQATTQIPKKLKGLFAARVQCRLRPYTTLDEATREHNDPKWLFDLPGCFRARNSWATTSRS